MNYLELFTTIFSEKKYVVAFFISLALLIPILAVTSNIIVPSTLKLNPFIEPQRIGIMSVIITLMALNGTVALYLFDVRRTIGKNTGFLGGLAAMFTSACPVCQPIWLIWLGFGSASAFLAEIGTYVGLISIILLLISLHYSLKAFGICGGKDRLVQ